MRVLVVSSLLFAMMLATPAMAQKKEKAPAQSQKPAAPAEPEQKTLNETVKPSSKKTAAKEGEATPDKKAGKPGERLPTQVPPTGASFFVSRIGEHTNRFSVLLSDTSGRTLTRSFSERQMSIFEAVLKEARRFAETDEAVGTTKPVITRIIDRNEPDFFVDVEKMGVQSKFYVTLNGMAGQSRLTIDAGSIQRGAAGPDPLFFKILERVLRRSAETSGRQR